MTRLKINKLTWDTIGHEEIKRIFSKQISTANLAQAYLFLGEKDLGKYHLAHDLARIIFCFYYHQINKLSSSEIPCGRCPHCSALVKKIHPDLMIVEKEPDKKYITIDQVAQLQSRLSLKSVFSGFKVAIIKEAFWLNKEAGNRLLKILEEPYPNTLIILTSDTLSKLLPTVISRCQILRFAPFTQAAALNYLKNKKLSQEKNSLIYSLTKGKQNLINNYFSDEVKLKIDADLLADSLKIFPQTKTGDCKLFYFENLIRSSENYNKKLELVNRLIDNWQLFLRDIQISLIDQTADYYFTDYQQTIVELSKLTDINKIQAMQKNILKLKSCFSYNPDINNIFYNIFFNLRLTFNI